MIKRTMSTFNKLHHLADSKAPIARLSAKTFFETLSPNEKLYAHHFSKASHWGTRAVLRSVSPESESIFDLIMKIDTVLSHDYTKLNIPAGDLQYYLEYASMLLANLGNYKSFGDTKFIPRLEQSQFQKFIDEINNNDISKLFNDIKSSIYDINEKTALLGDPSNGNISGYYLNDVTQIEGQAVDSALAKNNIMPENIRVERISSTEFIVHIASAFKSNATGYYPELIEFEIEDGRKASLTFKFGDHSREFTKIVENLTLAKEYASNSTQILMIEQYIQSFMTGSMKAHFDSQKYWVKDIKPQVETNIGFIETYRDYLGTKGEWEGLVAMVNKDRTAKFGSLVDNAKTFIKDLPWSNEFEKDKFTPPDFTSLEVLTFAGSGCPAGINIPNYDKIRINVGFKNVSLGNVLSAKSSKEPISFISEEDQELYEKYRVEAFEVQVGIHELLGHGTGKLLMELDDGKFNFDKEMPPLGVDGKTPVKTFYKKGETWGSLFGSIAGAYEECRAEAVAMYLGTNREILSIFGFNTKKEQDDIIYVMYLSMCRAGFCGMEYYNDGKWGQAHCQARYAILKTYLDAGNGLVKLESFDKKKKFEDLVIKVDREKIESVGQEAIGDLLKKLHIYKCSGNFVEGSEFFKLQSDVDDEMMKYRGIVLEKKLPRKQLIQANTVKSEIGVLCVEYEESELGMIESFTQREC